MSTDQIQIGRRRVVSALSAMHVDRTLNVTSEMSKELDAAWEALESAIRASVHQPAVATTSWPAAYNADLEQRVARLEHQVLEWLNYANGTSR